MLRWCLSTVRILGGHDTNSRTCHLFLMSRLSWSQCIRAYVEPAASSLAGLVEEPGSPIVASPHAQSLPTTTRNIGGPVRSSTRCSSIDALRQFLSPENVTSDRTLMYSPTTIRSFYYRAESRNQLGMLDSRMLSLLIGMFGSLSIDPRTSCTYRDPLACHLLKASMRRTHWTFILKVGRYKFERGDALQDSDRFWLMHAELAVVQAKLPSGSLSGHAYSAVLRARTHYHIIRRHSRHPAVHARYLEALLTTQDSRLLNFAACDLSFLIRRHGALHPPLQQVLYRLAVEYGEILSARSQEAILTALWSRSSQGTFNLVPENGVANMAADDCIFDATTIACFLSTTLFGIPGSLSNSIFFYSLYSVFSPAHALPLRWSSLVLLSIFNSPRVLRFAGASWASDHAIPQATLCWRVIFGLAAVEKAISQELSSAVAMEATFMDRVLQTTRTLYQMWMPVMKSRSVPRSVVCAVATSFLRVTSTLADEALFHDCQGLYHVKNSSVATRTSQTSVPRLLAAQYVAAAVRVQGPFLNVVLRALEALSLNSRQQHQVLASAVEALAPVDPSLAYTLYILAQEMGMGFDPGATHALAVSFARRGAFCEVIRFLNDDRLPLDQRGILISAIACGLRENPRRCHPPSVFVVIVDELAALYHSHVPPEHFRGHLEQLLVGLAERGRGRRLLPVLLSIFNQSPHFFQPRFFIRFCHVLLRHRQFSTASKLLGVIAAVHPKTARSLSIRTDRVVMQTKAFRSSKRITVRGRALLRPSSGLRRRFYAGCPLEISLQELLKSGRVLAAKHIFARAAATISSRRCTVLGNILLHGVSRRPASHNGRRVGKVLVLLENLVKNHGFRPDRVTANIIVKAMINWQSAFDSLQLRELFDQLVRGGYPAADHSPLHPPFNTRWTQVSTSSDFSTLPPFISFEKHTRPLFKMFIKAFYLCNDVEAARKVVGILKVEEHKNAETKEVRQRARSRGGG